MPELTTPATEANAHTLTAIGHHSYHLGDNSRLIIFGGSYFSVGDRVVFNGTQKMVVAADSTANTVFLSTFNDWDMDTHIPIQPNGPKKTKKKGDRFKPTMADRLAQSKAAKYGR